MRPAAAATVPVVAIGGLLLLRPGDKATARSSLRAGARGLVLLGQVVVGLLVLAQGSGAGSTTGLPAGLVAGSDFLDAEGEKREIARCGTPSIQGFLQHRSRLDPAVAAAIDAHLERGPRREPGHHELVSPAGRFRLHYVTEGADAVAPADVDPANGIPDLVEIAADALDRAWETLCEEIGLMPPVLAEAEYPVEFRATDYYGYVLPISPELGTSRLVLASDFGGAPPNSDPDGRVVGAIRVTCAHELRHASQYARSRWREGGWIELDAVWAEEMVFPAVDDYLYYLMRGCPIREPELPLDAGPTGTGSYEDCIWQLWLSQTHGPDAVADVWRRRADHPGESMLTSYDRALVARGSNLALGWRDFTAWNYAVGHRAVTEFGYEDAARYIAAPPTAHLDPGEEPYSGSVKRLAANFLRCELPAGAMGWVRVEFAGPADPSLVVSVMMEETGGSIQVLPILRDAAGEASLRLPIPAKDLSRLTLIVGNAATDGRTASYQVRCALESPQPEPILEVSRSRIEVRIAHGLTTRRTLTLRNVGVPESRLDYRVETQESPSGPEDRPWLHITPESGSISGGGQAILELGIDARELEPASYESALRICHEGSGEPVLVTLQMTVAPAEAAAEDAPRFALDGAFPNPCNPVTEVRFALPAQADVTLEVLDLRGRLVRTLHRESMPAGEHRIVWNGRAAGGAPAGSGLYLIRLRAAGQEAVAKVALTR